MNDSGFSIGLHWLVDEYILGVGAINTDTGRLYGLFLLSLVIGVRTHG